MKRYGTVLFESISGKLFHLKVTNEIITETGLRNQSLCQIVIKNHCINVSGLLYISFKSHFETNKIVTQINLYKKS